MSESFLKQNKNKFIGVVAAASTAMIGFTSYWEGNYYKAYRDPKGIPTICRGHTKGVYIGMKVSKEECDKFFIEDISPILLEIVADNPDLIDQKGAMYAAGDFSFNAGIGAYRKSPMYISFKNGEWDKGCNYFSNYYTGIWTSSMKGSDCRFDKIKKKYYCKLKGLVDRREAEKNLCLGKISVEDFATGE